VLNILMCNICVTCCLECFEQEVPEGAEDALAGLTFVISGTLDRYVLFVTELCTSITLYIL
jgi:hypothetical protein